MLTCMKPRLLRLQKSTKDSVWGIEVVMGATGPGLNSTSLEEQRRSRIRVWLKAIRTGRLVCWGQGIRGADFWGGRVDSGHNVQTMLW